MAACIVYCRVSTIDQAEEGTSLDSQERLCREYAADNDYQVVAVFKDTHTGAQFRERPGLSELRRMVRAGGIDVVLCYALDRLSRNQTHLAVLVEEIEHHGAKLDLVTETFDDTAVGKFIRSAMGFAAELEREKIVERQLRGKRERVLSGRLHNHAPELYGYRRNKEAGTRVIYEPEAVIVRQVFEWIVSERIGMQAIADRLNAQGTPPPSADKYTWDDPARRPKWRYSQIRRMLRNPAYKGETVLWTHESRSNGKFWQVRDETEWVHLPDGVTPAIVDVGLWESAQRVIASNRSGTTTRNTKRPALVRGLVSCATCGLPMWTDTGKGGKRYYRCSSRQINRKVCGGTSIRVDELDAWVWEQVTQYAGNPDRITRQQGRIQSTSDVPDLVERKSNLLRKVEDVSRAQERLVRRYSDAGDDAFPWSLLEQEVRRLEQEKDQLRAATEDLDRRINQAAEETIRVARVRELLDSVRARLEDATFKEQREIVELLGLEIVGNGKDWAVYLHEIEDHVDGV